MGLKAIIENNASVVLFATVLAGFMAGIGTMTFLEAREKDQREQIEAHEKEQRDLLVAQLQSQNKSLQVSNDQLDRAAKELLQKYLDRYLEEQAAHPGKAPSGDNAPRDEVVRRIQGVTPDSIGNIARDPIRCIAGRILGRC